jgi:hypothetical protein
MAEAEAGKLGINTTALTTEEILREEAAAIHGDKAKVVSDKTGAALYRELNGLNSAALCLSGGGIRSAAFALGVIQALATHPRPAKGATVATAEGSLLSTFHYLSTVSGGGYIGSWLSAWIKRAGFRGVWQSLVALPRRLGVEPPEIGWLRGYSNFLTPRVGIASADSWAGVALYFRNLILNWFVIIPALCAVLILLKLLAIAVVWVARSSPQSCGLFTGIAPAAIGLVFLIAALRFTTRHRPTRGHSTATQCDFLLWDWLPALLSAFLLTLAFASPCGETFARNVLDLSWARGLSRIGFCIATGATVYVVAWLIARPQFRGLKDYYSDLVAWAVAGAVFGSMIGCRIVSCYAGHNSLLATFGNRAAGHWTTLASVLPAFRRHDFCWLEQLRRRVRCRPRMAWSRRRLVPRGVTAMVRGCCVRLCKMGSGGELFAGLYQRQL